MIGWLLLGLAHAECTALVGGLGFLGEAQLSHQALVLKDEEVQGTTDSVPSDCKTVKLPQGAPVTTAFIEASTNQGLVEVG